MPDFHRTQRRPDLDIAIAVAPNLLKPEICSGRWNLEEVTIVPVPEASVHEDSCLVSRKDKIGLARQLPVMKPVAETQAVKPSPQHHFRLRIFRSDSRHHPAANFRRNDVSQRQPACDQAARWKQCAGLFPTLSPPMQPPDDLSWR